MTTGILGHKIGMTQIFNEEGNVIPVTIIKAGPCIITNINNNNIQIGYSLINPNKLNKPIRGFFKKKNLPCLKYLKEYSTNNETHKIIGQTISVKDFEIGNLINISGLTIGKGFSGYQKRHKFSRGPMSHGSKNHRQPGSIGAGTTPGRVFPGKKMAGKMGGYKTTIRNLKIIDINIDNHLLIIKGSIPGKSGNLIEIYKK
uniref:Large ribosomal subunit protein uL3c n=1 Tax=Wrangelia sp. TaxID=2575620 RepID=A0A4D6X5X8_9FLOR|nr:ribosomal protein L3 [Wrangelia sp.]